MEPAYQPCPVCPQVVELRVSDLLRLPVKVTCPGCATDLYFNLRKKGGGLFIPGVLIVLAYLFYAVSQVEEGAIFSWQFAAVIVFAFVVTQVIVAVFARSRVPLQTAEEASAIDQCPYCGKGLQSSAFRRPWDIECPHCRQRLQATWWSLVGGMWMAVYAGLVLVRIGSRYVPLSEAEVVVAVVGLAAAYYLFVSRHGLRVKRSSERKTSLP
jgi:hypothetical protein